MFIGLPPTIAVGTAKFGAFGAIIGSITRFKGSGHIRWDYVLILTLIGLPASYLGIHLLLSVGDQIIKTIVAAALFLTSAVLYLNRSLGVKRVVTSQSQKVAGYIGEFFIGLLHAGFSSGIGLLALPVHMYFLGMTAIEANATLKIPAVAKSVVIFITIVAAGIVSWGHAIAILLGSSIGSYIGAHIAIKKGNRFVKVVYAILLVAMSAKLLFS